MSRETAHAALSVVVTQHCYLFAALPVLFITMPFLKSTLHGLVTLNLINVFILIARLPGVFPPTAQR